MPPVTESSQPTETRTEQVNLSLTPSEKADIVRRAGEAQAQSGEVVTLPDFIRALIWPDGLQVAA